MLGGFKLGHSMLNSKRCQEDICWADVWLCVEKFNRYLQNAYNF